MSSKVQNALLEAFIRKNVAATVVDFDHYRIHGGLSVETDYIIQVKPIVDEDGTFNSFK